MTSTLLSHIRKVWGSDADPAGTTGYARFLIAAQSEEIDFHLRKTANEFADIIVIAFKWMHRNGFDPEQVIHERLEKRMKGKTRKIVQKYQGAYNKMLEGKKP